jgi:hypothetical protein
MVYSLITSEVTIVGKPTFRFLKIVNYSRKQGSVGQKSQFEAPKKERGPKTALVKELAHLLAPSKIARKILATSSALLGRLP